MGKLEMSSHVISAMIKMGYKSGTVLDCASVNEIIIGRLLYNYHMNTLPQTKINTKQNMDKIFQDINQAISNNQGSKKDEGNLEHLAELLLHKSQANDVLETEFVFRAEPVMKHFWQLLADYEEERNKKKVALGFA